MEPSPVGTVRVRLSKIDRMKRSPISGFLAPLLFIASSAADRPASVHHQIQQTYNFQPHLLSNQEWVLKKNVSRTSFSATSVAAKFFFSSVKRWLAEPGLSGD